MSNGIDESLQEVLNELPGRVSNQLLLGAIIELRTTLTAELQELNCRMDEFEGRLKIVELEERRQVENPSLIWLIRYRPGLVIKALILVLSLVGITNLPGWLGLLSNLFGG